MDCPDDEKFTVVETLTRRLERVREAVDEASCG